MTEFDAVVRQRRMTRAFERTQLADGQIERLVDLARRSPSAGNTQGCELVVLEGAATARFWDITLPAARRSTFRWQQLLNAPVIVLPFADRDAYLARYSETDKSRSGLGDAAAWPVPYWQLDAAMFVMTMLLAIEDAGLGALWFGVFHNSDELVASLNVPSGWQLIGALALGHPLPSGAGRSATRVRRDVGSIIHRRS